MSGAKGRSGGARPNAGGKRPGSGRPAKPAPKSNKADDDAKAFLVSIIEDKDADLRLRIDAAKALLPYQHPKLGEGGKKDLRKTASQLAARGKFAPSGPPRLVVNNGK